jgi:D-arabinose 1-dehydrogenase-like Zn-dependent alcohol dehydrogenase
MSDSARYSIPDQQARFAKAKDEKNARYLDITTVYDPSYLKGLRVAVTGANRGLGLAIAKELTEQGAKVVALVRSSSPELEALNPAEIVKGLDVTNDEKSEAIKDQIKGGPVDIVRTLCEEAERSLSTMSLIFLFVSFLFIPYIANQQRRVFLRETGDTR